MIYVLFVNLEILVDIFVLIGVLVVFVVLGLLFNGLVGVVCVVYIDNVYVLNLMCD